MNNGIKIIIITIFFAFLTNCASTTQYSQSQAFSSKTAKIHVVRSSAVLWGTAVSVPVYVNNQLVGSLGNNGSLDWVVTPGRVTVAVSEGAALRFQSGQPSAVSFVARPGKTYFVKVSLPYQLNMGNAAAEVQLVNSR